MIQLAVAIRVVLAEHNMWAVKTQTAACGTGCALTALPSLARRVPRRTSARMLGLLAN